MVENMLKKQFKRNWVRGLFIFTQLLALIHMFYMSMGAIYYYSQYDPEWELFLCLLGPFIIAKFFDWFPADPKDFIRKLKLQFDHEWVWRLYVVGQIIGVLFLMRMDLRESWDFFFDFFYNFFDYREIDQNQEALVYLVSPFVFTKTLDWIMAGSKKNL